MTAQHVEQACFLWWLRQCAADRPDHGFDDLADLDERIEAHLDGIRVAGDQGWASCLAELEWREPGEVFVATVLALELDRDADLLKIEGVAAAASQLEAALVAAFEWLPPDAARKRWLPWTASVDARRRALGLSAAHLHGSTPFDAAAYMNEPDSRVRAVMLRAAGQCGRVDMLSACESAARSEAAEVRYEGLRASLLLGKRSSAALLLDLARASASPDRVAVEMAGRALQREDALQWQRLFVQDQSPASQRLAVILAGSMGDPVLIEWLIEKMESASLARVAGEALVTITGVDLEALGLVGEPRSVPARPSDDPADEDVSPDPDHMLAWPEPKKVAQWWTRNRGELWPGHRYLLGRRIEPLSMKEILRAGSQRQRAAAALELKLAAPDQPLFDVRSPANVQRMRLEQHR